MKFSEEEAIRCSPLSPLQVLTVRKDTLTPGQSRLCKCLLLDHADPLLARCGTWSLEKEQCTEGLGTDSRSLQNCLETFHRSCRTIHRRLAGGQNGEGNMRDSRRHRTTLWQFPGVGGPRYLGDQNPRGYPLMTWGSQT
jgi:hypothetical protein